VPRLDYKQPAAREQKISLQHAAEGSNQTHAIFGAWTRIKIAFVTSTYAPETRGIYGTYLEGGLLVTVAFTTNVWNKYRQRSRQKNVREIERYETLINIMGST
jgi:hypothetical protein